MSVYSVHEVHTCSVTLSDFSFFMLKDMFVELFLTYIERLKIEGHLCCTDCKAVSGKLSLVYKAYVVCPISRSLQYRGGGVTQVLPV